MTEQAKLEALDFAALLCSRVCHDIISPVGAITNGPGGVRRGLENMQRDLEIALGGR